MMLLKYLFSYDILLIFFFSDRPSFLFCFLFQYKVVAKNIVGEAETSAKLTLAQIEPSFIEPLKRVTEVSEGEPLDISTKVIGSPIPAVQWLVLLVF